MSLEWQTRPSLREPIIVCAFKGWNDAGEAASAAVQFLFEAFDDAWKSIEGNFGGDAAAVEAARTRLANSVLAISRDGVSDPIAIKNAALQAIALDYKGELR